MSLFVLLLPIEIENRKIVNCEQLMTLVVFIFLLHSNNDKWVDDIWKCIESSHFIFYFQFNHQTHKTCIIYDYSLLMIHFLLVFLLLLFFSILLSGLCFDAAGFLHSLSKKLFIQFYEIEPS